VRQDAGTLLASGVQLAVGVSAEVAFDRHLIELRLLRIQYAVEHAR